MSEYHDISYWKAQAEAGQRDATYYRRKLNAEQHFSASLRAELDRLRDALSEVREVYAGSEGIPVGETAAEAYVVRLIEQMYRISVEALDTKEVGDGLHDVSER